MKTNLLLMSIAAGALGSVLVVGPVELSRRADARKAMAADQHVNARLDRLDYETLCGAWVAAMMSHNADQTENNLRLELHLPVDAEAEARSEATADTQGEQLAAWCKAHPGWDKMKWP